MGAAVDRGLAFLDTVSVGGDWVSHAPLLASITDLAATQAAWKPSPQRKSIWEIANHVAFWTEYFASQVAGEPPRLSGWYKELEWQPLPEVTEDGWRQAIQRLRDAHEAFKAELAKRSDEQLEQPLPSSRTPLYAYILTEVTHRSYHCGQIMYLRALQGLPPLESLD